VSRIIPTLPFLLWPAAVIFALVIFGLSSTAALSMLQEGLKAPVTEASGTPRVFQKSPTIRAPQNRALLWSARSIASSESIAVAPPQPLRAVARRGLTLRSKPTQTASALATLGKGAEVMVMTKQGRWWKVRTSDDQEGWLYASYLSVRNF
jgi:uncharacterized protein YgiM (DUF1202 family)